MNSKLFHLLAFIGFFTFQLNQCYSQTIFNYTTANTSTTLCNNKVNCIVQDKDGVMWIGTDYGISRFDGKNWSTFTTENALTSNKIYDVAVDSANNKWFATGNSLTKFDGKKWTNYQTEKKYDFDNYLGFYSVTIENNGTIWLWSGYSIYKFTEPGNFTLQTNRYDANYFYSIFIDKKGTKWACSLNCLQAIDANYKDIASGFWKTRALCYDKEGNIWAASNDGICKYKVENDTIKQIGFIELKINYCRSIYVDYQGNIWLDSGSLLMFDGKEWNNMSNFTEISEHLWDNSLKTFYVDIQGNIWAGTYNGLYKYDGENWTSYLSNGLSSNEVSSIAADSKGSVWLASQYGLTQFSNGTWTNFYQQKGKKVFVDTQDKIWVCNNNEPLISVYDNKDWTKYLEYFVYGVEQDYKGNLWFDVYKGGKIVVLQNNGKSWFYYNDKKLVESNYSSYVDFDSDGKMLVKTIDGIWKKADDDSYEGHFNCTDILNNKWYSTNINNVIVNRGVNVTFDSLSPFLAANVNSVYFNENGGNSETIRLLTNVDWKIQSGVDWVKLDTSEGKGDSNIIITADENITSETRTGAINILGPDSSSTQVPIKITITQKAKVEEKQLPYLDLFVYRIEASSSDTTVFIKIKSNTDWQINPVDDWFQTDITKGSGDTLIKLRIMKNENIESRVSFLKFSGKEVATKKINIEQAGNEPIYFPLSVNDNNNAISIYPNPLSNSLKLRNMVIGSVVYIYNMNGLEISHKKILNNLETIDVTGFKKGFYVLKYIHGNNAQLYKLIK